MSDYKRTMSMFCTKEDFYRDKAEFFEIKFDKAEKELDELKAERDELLEEIEDAEFALIAERRKGNKTVKVDLNTLGKEQD
jgi:uncharacterized coiled-coil DUF342 family protein